MSVDASKLLLFIFVDDYSKWHCLGPLIFMDDIWFCLSVEPNSSKRPGFPYRVKYLSGCGPHLRRGQASDTSLVSPKSTRDTLFKPVRRSVSGDEANSKKPGGVNLSVWIQARFKSPVDVAHRGVVISVTWETQHLFHSVVCCFARTNIQHRK